MEHALHAAGASVKLFLFGEAHDEHRQLSQGSLLAAWGGKVNATLKP